MEQVAEPLDLPASKLKPWDYGLVSPDRATFPNVLNFDLKMSFTSLVGFIPGHLKAILNVIVFLISLSACFYKYLEKLLIAIC